MPAAGAVEHFYSIVSNCCLGFPSAGHDPGLPSGTSPPVTSNDRRRSHLACSRHTRKADSHSLKGHTPSRCHLHRVRHFLPKRSYKRGMDLHQLEKGLAAFAVLDPTHLPIHFVQVFLFVARNSPCTFKEVMDGLDLSNSAVSRTAMALGQENRRGQPGFDLLTVAKDPKEGRRLILMLTPKGKALHRQISEI